MEPPPTSGLSANTNIGACDVPSVVNVLRSECRRDVNIATPIVNIRRTFVNFRENIGDSSSVRRLPAPSEPGHREPLSLSCVRVWPRTPTRTRLTLNPDTNHSNPDTIPDGGARGVRDGQPGHTVSAPTGAST